MLKITKLDSARRHLAVAIKLFFEGGDPVVIHTLAAAAQGVIRDIASNANLAHTSILHDHPNIPQPIRRTWINLLNTPRNFFKHADIDPHAVLDFDESSNIILILDAVIILSEIDDHPPIEAKVYVGWFTTANPVLQNAIANNTIGDYAVRNNIKSTDFKAFRELCNSFILIDSL